MEAEAQRRRSSSASSSPEFEFWKVRNTSFAPPDLLTADELIVDGVLLPLHLLSLQRSDTARDPPPSPPTTLPPASVLSSSSFSAAPTSCSRRWKDLFRAVGEKKPEEKEKERKKQRRSSISSSGSSELNINLNIWPFSRSRSAGNSTGNTAGRSRSASSIAGRKVSSAPCSRSNSRGDSAAACRRWAASPGRGGVHLGRSSPMWQLRRTGMVPKEKARKSVPAASTFPALAGGGGVRVLNLNVNSCIGYRNQVSCRDDDSDGLTGSARTADGSNAFSFRALFSKKVY